MGLLKKIFGESDKMETTQLNWIPLTSIVQIENLDSSVKTIGIFKHSTRCIVSSMAKKQLERSFNLTTEQVEMYYLDLIANRELSNLIELNFGIRHESPQLLLLKYNEVVAHASHQSIANLEIEKYV